MREKLLLLLFTALCGYSPLLKAQNLETVSGMVKDAQGKPLQNVSVRPVASKTGTTTDENGHFSMKLKSLDVVMEFSYVGFRLQKIKLAGRTELTVVLKEDEDKNMTDVIVVGTQRQSKRNTTAAVSSVSGKVLENIPAASVDALLQGRVAGLNVQISSGEPGVTPTIVVRGNSRVSTGISDQNVAQAQALSGPLYVIDGIPVLPDDIANNIDATGTNYLAGINVNDIESVDVQKDAAATAAWGSRGSNGVIYIKTRRGRSATPEFRVNVYAGVVRQPPLLKTATGAAERSEKMNIINQYVSPGSPILSNLPQLLTDSMNPYFNNATDWQGIFYRGGATQNVDVTMSAATENVNYRVSMNYYNEKGIIDAFGFTRYSVRGNFDFKINSRLNSQFIVAISKGDRKRGRKYYNNSDDNTPLSGPSQPSSFFRLTAFDSLNFSGLYSKLRNSNVNDLYSTSLTLNYTILPSLKYTFQGAANVSTSNRDYFAPSNIDQVAAIPQADGTPAPAQPSQAESDKGVYSTYFTSNSLTFAKKITTANDHTHNFIFTGTQQFNVDVSNSNSVGGLNIPSNDIQVVRGMPQSDVYGYDHNNYGIYSDYASDALLSFSGQLQYDYDGKYLLYGSYRGDGSSRFGNNTKWGYFPAVGAGWIISDEKFMTGAKDIMNFLKLRGSYGISGSQSPDFYAPYNSYVLPGTYGGAAAVAPSYTNGLTKNDLTWAKTIQKNLGIEAQFLDSRISLIVDAYDKISKDDYYKFPLPFYTGFQSIDFNAHDLWVSNRGADITLIARIFPRKSALQWTTQATISYNKNAIAKLPNNNRTFVVNDYSGISRIYSVGQPIYELFQMKYEGVYNKQSEIPFNPNTGKGLTYFKGNHPVVPGDPIWKDVNKIGDVWDGEDNGDQYGDRVPTGNPNPLFTGGWVNDFTYKNFSLSIVSVFTWKRDIINTFEQQQFDAIGGNIYNFAQNRLPDLSKIDYWTPGKAAAKSNYKANFPSINPFAGYYYQFFPFSSMWTEDGSYFKIKTITAGYQVPKSFIQKIKISGMRIYGTADNILTLKKSSIPNPESVDQIGIYTGGLYPTPTTFTLGLDVQF